MFLNVPIAAVVAQAFAVTPVSAQSEQSAVDVRNHLVPDSLPFIRAADADDHDVALAVISIPTAEALHWDAKASRRFDRLAERYALGVADNEDIEELKHLQHVRNEAIPSLPCSEIEKLLTRRRLTADLISTLAEYVHFERAANKPPGESSRKV